jgi:hypothetical protein
MKASRVFLIVGIGAAIYALLRMRSQNAPPQAGRNGAFQHEAQSTWESEGGSLAPDQARSAGAI